MNGIHIISHLQYANCTQDYVHVKIGGLSIVVSMEVHSANIEAVVDDMEKIL